MESLKNPVVGNAFFALLVAREAIATGLASSIVVPCASMLPNPVL